MMAARKPAILHIRNWVKSILVVATFVASGAAPTPAAAACALWEPLTFAVLDWDSAKLHAAIASHIVREGYGCEVDAVPGGTLDSFSRLSAGVVDVMMETWKDNIEETWDRAEESGHIIDAGVVYGGALQGWYVPRYLIEGDARRGIKALAPDLRSVHDLARHSRLFAETPGDGKGVFMNCVSSWGCEQINTRKLKIYGLDTLFTNRRPANGDELAAYIATRYEKGLPFVAYYWEPTWVTGAYDLVLLEEPAYEESAWKNLVGSPDATQATAYPTSNVHKGVIFTLEIEAPELLDFFEKYSMPTPLVSDLTAIQRKNNYSMEDTVRYFLKTKPDIWKTWIPDQVAKRVEMSLDDGR